MSTNAIIRISGQKECIYSHWDGDLSGVGSTLLRHYSKKRKLKKLLSLGNISILASKIKSIKPHSFEKPVDGVTIAYHRDRGEEFAMGEQYCGEFDYEFRKGKWYVDEGNGHVLLTQELINS
jgi:hypothetical protein